VGLLLAPTPSLEAAQRPQDPDTTVQFNLSTPGARSLALGGAFLGLADDATAAYTNPAGLTNLTVGGSEVALEVRHWRFNETFPSGGNEDLTFDQSGGPTNVGIDTLVGFDFQTTESEETGLSFLSYAHVFPRGVTVALYRHELANFSSQFESQGGFLTLDDFTGGMRQVLDFRLDPKRSFTDLEIVNIGASGAFELQLPSIESSLSLGLGVSYYEFDLESRVDFYDWEDAVGNDVVDRMTGNQFGPADFSPDNIYNTVFQSGEDEAFGMNFGFLLKIGRQRRWSVGGVFREGAEFETRFVEFECDFAAGPPFGNCPQVSGDERGTITVPDAYGIGMAYRAHGGRTKVLLDVNRVEYSQRATDFRIDAFGSEENDFITEDSDEVHVGFERIFLVVESLFVGTLRLGAWNEPFHELEYKGPDELSRALLRDPDDEIHLSIGFGLVIKEDYQIDIAADFSDPGDTYSVSVVKFF
jgi:hypothetical protein